MISTRVGRVVAGPVVGWAWVVARVMSTTAARITNFVRDAVRVRIRGMIASAAGRVFVVRRPLTSGAPCVRGFFGFLTKSVVFPGDYRRPIAPGYSARSGDSAWLIASSSRSKCWSGWKFTSSFRPKARCSPGRPTASGGPQFAGGPGGAGAARRVAGDEQRGRGVGHQGGAGAGVPNRQAHQVGS